ncbi:MULTISPECIES: iron-sulfur cluster biosynthesis family protein [unclassified Enterococcus]|uniref:iron-sulfur cluster biosynthesis family protein n=1 Tax=unclassified Enterococcus TaxID=2608891 RepID=UPI0013ECF76C|nr:MULTISPECIES: iron-sulfur cluster biosynthesis family protein [unclassified Enterococcus]
MHIQFDEASAAKIRQHLVSGNKLLLTFEDGVGPYSQHAMIHMQVQFSINIIGPEMTTQGYDQKITSNIGDILVKGYSLEDLDEHMNIRLNTSHNTLSLSGDSGLIDNNLGFIDFAEANKGPKES